MNQNTILALAATIYYKVSWDNKFQSQLIEEDVFHAASGDVTSESMRQRSAGIYYWGDSFSAVSRNFTEGGSMWLILPDEGISPETLLNDSEALAFMLTGKKKSWEKYKYLLINQSVPKFDVSDSFDMCGGLANLGVSDVFDASVSDFTPVTTDTRTEPLYPRLPMLPAL